jgi:hypothetical protein
MARRVLQDRRRHERLDAEERRKQPDRRLSERYRVKDGIFAVLIATRDKLGQIKDISLRGLSFRYVNNDKYSKESGELKIIIAGCGLYMDKLAIETISDFEIKGGFSISPLKLRQTGVKFVDLTSEQRARIEAFIVQHAVGKA